MCYAVTKFLSGRRRRRRVEMVENVYKPIRKQQIENFKILILACSNPARDENLFRFVLSLTVSEITANLSFQGHVTLRVM